MKGTRVALYGAIVTAGCTGLETDNPVPAGTGVTVPPLLFVEPVFVETDDIEFKTARVFGPT